MTARFRASTAVIDVTPPVGFPLGGYILRSGVSVGTLDPILARLILLTSGDDALLVISLDWVYIDGRWAADVRQAVENETGIGAADVIVTATHTHSGPGIFRSSVTAADDEPAYLSGVSGRIVEAAGTLATTTREVAAAIGSSRVLGLGTHRNEPGLPVDNVLSVLTFREPAKKPCARIMVYGCHGTLLGADNLLYSGDWVGYGLADVDRRMGGMSLFINGAAGDVSTRFTRRGRGMQELERYAGIFADAARRAEKSSVPVSETGITVRTKQVPVKYRKLPGRDEAQRQLSQVEAAINDLAKMGGAPPGRVRRLEAMREGALASLFFASGGGFEKVFGERPMTATVTLARIGSVGLLFFPGEVMSTSALNLRAGMDGVVAVCGYANDYFGYLNRGSGEYESSMTLLSPDSVAAVVGAGRRLIDEVM